MAGSDFINIELSAAGLQMAGAGGSVRVTARHMNYEIKAGASVRVLTSEWSLVLSKHFYDGQPVFQASAPKKSAAAQEEVGNEEGGK